MVREWCLDKRQKTETKDEKTNRQKYKMMKNKGEKDQKESLIFWGEGSFALLRCWWQPFDFVLCFAPQQKCVLDPMWSFYEERFFDSAHLSIHPLFWTIGSKCSWYYHADVEKWSNVKFYSFKSVEFSFRLNELLPTFLLRPRVTLIVPACQPEWEKMEKFERK